jgi:hypothetical protein
MPKESRDGRCSVGQRAKAAYKKFQELGNTAQGVLAIGTIVVVVVGWLGVTKLTESNVELAIDPPESGKVPRCAVIKGSASTLEGKDLWLAFQLAGGGHYSLKRADVLPHRRFLAQTNLGSTKGADVQYNVHAFYLDKTESQFLEGLTARALDGKPAYTLYNHLPPRRQHEISGLVVRDGAANQECP